MVFKKLFFIVGFFFSLQGETFQDLIKKSATFTFPTISNKISVLAYGDNLKQDSIVQQANSVRPIIHKNVMSLIKDFLEYKRQYGTSIEKKLYKDMTEQIFIDRLLTKRPLMFMTKADTYLLRNGIKGQGGFEAIGTSNEKKPLALADYLSYDEIAISALLGVSGPTYFINNGSRNNKGIIGAAGTYQESGIYVGLVGARFEKPGLMEWQHMIITPEQNTKENGYGSGNGNLLLQVWSKFYGERFVTFQEAKEDLSGRYIELNSTTFLDSLIYKKRMKMVLEPFFIEANKRGMEENKKVYCHVVGLGLGVWQKTSQQTGLILDVCGEIFNKHDLSFISDLNFSWFLEKFKKFENKNKNEIKVHFSKRNPANKLIGDDAGKLLVAMYAWDGNAFPGNEYWAGHLTASGDPAAASCSTIAELHNPLINDNVSYKNLAIFG